MLITMLVPELYLIEILHQTTTRCAVADHFVELYLIEILHQTTTQPRCEDRHQELYLIEILHQTTTLNWNVVYRYRLYLIEILHQTTTPDSQGLHFRRCILSKFYIKPQRRIAKGYIFVVVSYRNSTSNHN